MSETVDTRVVEAKFDSKQFEQGVNKTVKKLDELKTSLNDLTKEKTVEELGNKVKDSTEKASNSLETLQERFTSFTGMLKQKLLSGIADEIVGVFFKIKNGFESLVSSLSSAQVSVGMQRYTDILTSVRTLTAAGVVQDKAYEAIDRLGQYADQTSYSLDSMVATMSKFKTAGADIDTAARMIEGLSNAAASMGVNAQQAERAYLNLQQAYSKKVMLQNDWISFESLPMVGTQFNQAILDAAVKVGTLEEVKGKPGTYKTKKKAGTKVKAASGITADNLGANLASRWFTDEVMEEVFGNTYYFAEVGIDEVNAIKDKEREIRKEVQKKVDSGELDKAKFDEEVNNKLQEYFDEETKVKLDNKKTEIEERKETARLELEARKITKTEYDKLIAELDKEFKDFEAENHLSAFAYNAFRAGQEARSFTDVLNTLKDAISRGWAKSFELIFGRLDEAAEFFTKLTESKFAEGIYAIGEFRNAVLQNWRDTGGRENLLGVLQYIDDIAGSIWEKLGLIRDSEKWFEENFNKTLYNQLLNTQGKEAAESYKENMKAESQKSPFERIARDLGQRLTVLTRNIGLFFDRVKNWFNEVDGEGVSRIQRISNIISNFGTVFSGSLSAIGVAIEGLGKVYNELKPVFDSLWRVIQKITQPIADLFNPKLVDNNGQNAYTHISNLFENLAEVANKLAGPLAAIIDVLGDIATFFIQMSLGTVTMNLQFFSDAFGLLLEILGFDSAQTKNGKSVAQGIADDITSLGNACKDAFQAVSDFFSSVIADIRTWLGLSDEVDEEGNKKKSIFQNIENWFNTNEVVLKIKSALKNFNLIDIVKGIFYEKKTTSIYYDNKGRHEVFEWVEKDFTKSIREWFENLPTKISNLGITIGDLIKSIFYEKKSKVLWTDAGKQELFFWVEKDFTKNIKKWFKELPGKIKNLGITFGELIKSIFYDKKSKVLYNADTKQKEEVFYWVEKDFTTQIKDFVKNIPVYIHDALSGIGSFLSMVWNALLGNDPNAGSTEAADAADAIQKDIDESFGGIDPNSVLGKLKTVGENIWNGILTIFTGNTDKEFNNNWIAEKVKAGIEKIGEFADEAWKTASEFVVTLPDTIASIFSNEEEANDNPKQGTLGATIHDFIKKIGTWISTIPDTLLSFWENAEKQLGTLWSNILGWITGEKSFGDTSATKLKGKWKLLYEQALGVGNAEQRDAMIKTAEAGQWREDNPILVNLANFFDHVKQYVIDRITNLPNDIASGLAAGANLLNTLFEKVTGWFKKENKKDVAEQATEAIAEDFQKDDQGDTFLKSLSDFGATLALMITQTIPGFISEGFEWVKNNAKSWYESLRGLFSGGEKTAEEETQSFGMKIVGFLKDIFKPHTFDQFTYDNILREGGFGAAERYKDASSNPIVVFFKGVVKTIGEIFQDIGPTILDGINKAFTWIGTKLGDVTKFITELSNENKSINEVLSEKMIDKETGQENPMWTAVKSLGQTIWDMLTQTIPKFITSAATYIAQQVPSLFSGFLGGGSEAAVEEVAKEEQDTLDALIAARNEAIKNRDFDTANALAAQIEERQNKTKNTNIIASLFGVNIAYGEEAAEQAMQQYSDILDAASNNTEKEKEIIKKKEEMEKDLADVNQKLSEYSDLQALDIPLTEDQVNDQKDLLLKQAELQQALAELNKNSDSNAVKNVETATIGLGGILSSVEKLVTNPGLKTVAVLAIVAYVIEALRDIFTLTDEMEVGAYTAKWVGISALMVGLTTMMGYMMYLAKYDPETYQKIAEDLEGIEAWITTILALVTVIIGAISGADIVDSLTGSSEELESAGKKGGFIKNLLTGFLGGFMKMVGAGAGFNLTTSLIGEGLENMGNAIAEMFGGISMGIDNFTTILLPAIGNLADMDTQLDKANEVIDDLTLLMEKLKELTGLKYVETLTQSINRDIGGVSSEGLEFNESDALLFQSQADTFLIFIMTIGSFLSNLSNALKNMEAVTAPVSEMSKLVETVKSQEFKDFMTTVDEVVGDVFFNTFNTIASLHEKYSWDIDTRTLSAYFTILGGALNAMATGCSGITMDNVTAITAAFEVIKALSKDLIKELGTDQGALSAALFGDKSISHFGYEIELFATYFKMFFDKIGEINLQIDNENKINTLEYKTQYAMATLQRMAEIMSSTTMPGEVEDAAKRMQKLVEAFRTLKLNENFTPIKDFINLFDNTNFKNGSLENVYMFFTGLDNLASALSTFGIYSSDISRGMTRLQEFSWTDLSGILTDMNAAFVEVDENGDMKFSITPVLVIDDAFEKEAAKLRNLIGMTNETEVDGNIKYSFDPGFNLEELKPKDFYGEILDKINTKLDDLSTINTNVSNIDTTASNFNTSLSNVKFVINGREFTATIGPEMDQWLGTEGYHTVRSTFTGGSKA